MLHTIPVMPGHRISLHYPGYSIQVMYTHVDESESKSFLTQMLSESTRLPLPRQRNQKIGAYLSNNASHSFRGYKEADSFVCLSFFASLVTRRKRLQKYFKEISKPIIDPNPVFIGKEKFHLVLGIDYQNSNRPIVRLVPQLDPRELSLYRGVVVRNPSVAA